MQTGVLCCCCFLAFRCCCGFSSPAPSPPVRDTPCHAMLDPSIPSSSSDGPRLLLCVFLPFPHSCLPGIRQLLCQKCRLPLLYSDKGGKKKDKMLLLLLMRGSDAIHAPPCSKPNEKRKKKDRSQWSSCPMRCNAMRSRDVDPHKHACPDEKRKKMAKDNVGCPMVTWCRLPAGTHAARVVVVWLFDLECSIVPQSIALHAGIRDGTAPVFFPSSLTGRR